MGIFWNRGIFPLTADSAFWLGIFASFFCNWLKFSFQIFSFSLIGQRRFDLFCVNHFLRRFWLVAGISNFRLFAIAFMNFLALLISTKKFFSEFFQDFLRNLFYQDFILRPERNKFVWIRILVQLIFCLNVAVHFIFYSHGDTNSNNIPGWFVRVIFEPKLFFWKIVRICFDLVEQIDLWKGRLSHWDVFNFQISCNVRINRLADFSEGFKHFFFVVFRQIVPQNVPVFFIGSLLDANVNLASNCV